MRNISRNNKYSHDYKSIITRTIALGHANGKNREEINQDIKNILAKIDFSHDCRVDSRTVTKKDMRNYDWVEFDLDKALSGDMGMNEYPDYDDVVIDDEYTFDDLL